MIINTFLYSKSKYLYPLLFSTMITLAFAATNDTNDNITKLITNIINTDSIHSKCVIVLDGAACQTCMNDASIVNLCKDIKTSSIQDNVKIFLITVFEDTLEYKNISDKFTNIDSLIILTDDNAISFVKNYAPPIIIFSRGGVTRSIYGLRNQGIKSIYEDFSLKRKTTLIDTLHPITEGYFFQKSNRNNLLVIYDFAYNRLQYFTYSDGSLLRSLNTNNKDEMLRYFNIPLTELLKDSSLNKPFIFNPCYSFLNSGENKKDSIIYYFELATEKSIDTLKSKDPSGSMHLIPVPRAKYSTFTAKSTDLINIKTQIVEKDDYYNVKTIFSSNDQLVYLCRRRSNNTDSPQDSVYILATNNFSFSNVEYLITVKTLEKLFNTKFDVSYIGECSYDPLTKTIIYLNAHNKVFFSYSLENKVITPLLPKGYLADIVFGKNSSYTTSSVKSFNGYFYLLLTLSYTTEKTLKPDLVFQKYDNYGTLLQEHTILTSNSDKMNKASILDINNQGIELIVKRKKSRWGIEIYPSF